MEPSPLPGLPPVPPVEQPGAPRLEVLGDRFRPIMLATDRVIPVLGSVGDALPDDGLRRGTVVSVAGAPGAGATSLALDLLAAVTAAGEWVAVVTLQGARGSVAVPAAVEVGVALDRLALVRGVPPDRWAVVVAALVEGVSLVVADLPPRVRLADARRIAARARERGSVLVTLGSQWPERVAVRLRAEGGPWRFASGRLAGRDLTVEVETRGHAGQRRVS